MPIQVDCFFVVDEAQRGREVLSSLQRRAREMNVDLHGGVHTEQADSEEKAREESRKLDERHAAEDAAYSVSAEEKARAVWEGGVPPVH